MPEDGVLIHGLYIDAGRWDFKSMKLIDEYLGKMLILEILFF